MNRMVGLRGVIVLAVAVSGAAIPAAARAAESVITVSVEPGRLAANEQVRVKGTVSPAPGGPVQVQVRTSAGWTDAISLATDPSGSFNADVTPVAPDSRGVSALRIVEPGTEVASEPVALAITAALEVPALDVDYLGRERVTIGVYPRAYRGRVTVRDRAGRTLGSAPAVDGRARLDLTAQQLGRQNVTVQSTADGDLVAGTEKSVLRSQWVRLQRGSTGPVVAGLVRKLRSLNFHTPPVGERFDAPVGDVVMAFKKTEELPRNERMDRRAWRTLDAADPVKPRFRGGKGVHIEVDKTRQILMLVRNGEVKGTLHVSTGATGNTPEGRFRIYEKGVGSLFRFMGFKGNFGIHGYIPVPPFPASHGCVREPMWAADWTYRRSPIGTPVIIYT